MKVNEREFYCTKCFILGRDQRQVSVCTCQSLSLTLTENQQDIIELTRHFLQTLLSPSGEWQSLEYGNTFLWQATVAKGEVFEFTSISGNVHHTLKYHCANFHVFIANWTMITWHFTYEDSLTVRVQYPGNSPVETHCCCPDGKLGC